MKIEFDSRFGVLLEAERQMLASRKQTETSDSLLIQRSGDGFGGRFDNQSKVIRRETGQRNMEVSAGRI